MKIERIDDNIIRVTVSIDDLEERDIDVDNLNYNSQGAQELFWDMMEQAEMEFGFNVIESQIIIEPAADEDDEGIIITITRLDEDGDFESIHKYIRNKFKKSDLKIKRKTNKNPAVFIYSFNSFEDLCTLSNLIKGLFLGSSSVYTDKGTYYLVLRRDNLLITDTTLMQSHLEEFGQKVHKKAVFEGFLNEHCSLLIAEGAIEKLTRYFK